MKIEAERLEKMKWVVAEVKRDCEADVAKREGMPLTGRNVAEALGETCGLIVGLANVLEALLEEVEPRGEG